MNGKPVATILNYQRLSTEDGPGIRTTVFFKGCPLSCAWCHNPESISPRQELQWMTTRCIGCMSCLGVCHQGALHYSEGQLQIERSRCTMCGACWEECPARAIEVIGEKSNLEELLLTLQKDLTYYQKSAGGVTFSGGEPTLYSDFLLEASQRLQASGIHVALDTCGFYNPSAMNSLLPWIDLILFDLKIFDSSIHQQYCGQPNQRILDNLSKLIEYRKTSFSDFDIWIRTPLIPGVTATSQNLKSIASYLLDLGVDQIARWELCAFNNLCRDKYSRLDLIWQFADLPLMTAEELIQCRQWALDAGFPPEKIAATGAARFEKESEVVEP